MSQRTISFIMTCVVGWVCIFTGEYIGASRQREKDIKAGVAHYEVNPTTGETKFIYNTPKPPPESERER